MTRPYNPLPTPRLVHRPMAQWPAQRRSLDRFTVAIIAALLAITFIAVLFAIKPAASSAPNPRADASSVRDVEAVAGRDLPQ